MSIAPIFRLPEDNQRYILNNFLRVKELDAAARTCKTWKRIVSDPTSWVIVAEHHGLKDKACLQDYYKRVSGFLDRFRQTCPVEAQIIPLTKEAGLFENYRKCIRFLKERYKPSVLQAVIAEDFSYKTGTVQKLLPVYARQCPDVAPESPSKPLHDATAFGSLLSFTRDPEMLRLILSYPQKISNATLGESLISYARLGDSAAMQELLIHHQRISDEALGNALFRPIYHSEQIDLSGVAKLLLPYHARIRSVYFSESFILCAHFKIHGQELCRLLLQYPDKISDESIAELLRRAAPEHAGVTEVLMQYYHQKLGNTDAFKRILRTALESIFEDWSWGDARESLQFLLYYYRDLIDLDHARALVKKLPDSDRILALLEPRGQKRAAPTSLEKDAPTKREKPV